MNPINIVPFNAEAAELLYIVIATEPDETTACKLTAVTVFVPPMIEVNTTLLEEITELVNVTK